MKNFNVYFILQFCQLESDIEIDGNTTVFPFPPLKPVSANLRYVIDQLSEHKKRRGDFKKYLDPNEIEKQIQENIRMFEKANPSAIIELRGIEAENEESASKSVERKARKILHLLSMFKNVRLNIHLTGVVDLTEPEKKHVFIAIDIPGITFYQPLESDTAIQEYFKNAGDKVFLEEALSETALEWYYEALGMTNQKLKYLAFWYALEMLAEVDYEPASILTKEDKKQLTSYIEKIVKAKSDILTDAQRERINSLIGQINNPSIKEKIKNTLEKWKYNLKVDEIDFLYQVRNCLSHTGQCRLFDSRECRQKSYERWCKDYSAEDAIKKVRNPALFLVAAKNRIFVKFDQGRC